MLEDFRYVQHFRVTFGEVDMMRHVNNTVYLKWAETIRVEYMNEVLGQRAGAAGETGIILAKIVNEYEAPLRFREHVAVGTRIARIGNKSMDFRHEIWSADREVRCASGTATVVGYDYTTETTIAIPPAWRAAIERYELIPTLGSGNSP